MSEEKRVRRTPEQIAADLDVQIEKLKDSILELENKKAASATEFDNKIAAVKEKIAKLEAKKKDVLTPKKRKPRKSKADQIKLLVRQAQKSGMKLDEIAESVKNSAYDIIAKKQATYYGIAMSVRRICACIIRNERSILPVSSMMHGEYGIHNIALSMPAILGADGVETHVPVSLNEDETTRLIQSAKTLGEIAQELEL